MQLGASQAEARSAAMRRLPCLVFALASVAAAVEDRREPVRVAGFPLPPLAHLTWADDRLELHPKALLGAGWDSNVYGRSADERSDIHLRQLAGVETRWHAGRMHEVLVDLELDRRDYLGENDLDLTGGRAEAAWRREASRSTMGARVGYARDDTPLVESGELIARDEAVAALDGGWSAAAMRYAGSASVTRLDYRRDSRFFTADQRDALRPAVTVRLGYVDARESELYGSLRLDRIAYSTNERYQDSDGVRIVAGYRGRLAVRSRFSIEAGLDHRRYRANAIADDSAVTRPGFEATVRWPWEEGSEVGLRVYSEVQDGIAGGAAWETGAGLDLRYRLLVNAALLAELGLVRIEPETGIAGAGGGTRTNRSARAGAEYQLREGVGVRLLGGWQDGRQPDGEAFTRFGAELALAVAF